MRSSRVIRPLLVGAIFSSITLIFTFNSHADADQSVEIETSTPPAAQVPQHKVGDASAVMPIVNGIEDDDDDEKVAGKKADKEDDDDGEKKATAKKADKQDDDDDDKVAGKKSEKEDDDDDDKKATGKKADKEDKDEDDAPLMKRLHHLEKEVLPAFEWVEYGMILCPDARHTTLSANSWALRAVVRGAG